MLIKKDEDLLLDDDDGAFLLFFLPLFSRVFCLTSVFLQLIRSGCELRRNVLKYNEGRFLFRRKVTKKEDEKNCANSSTFSSFSDSFAFFCSSEKEKRTFFTSSVSCRLKNFRFVGEILAKKAFFPHTHKKRSKRSNICKNRR